MNKKYEYKKCACCQRDFQNRKKWAARGIWDDIKFCSVRCQKLKTYDSWSRHKK